MTDGKTHFADDDTLDYIDKLEKLLRDIRLCAGMDGSRGWKFVADEITKVLGE